MRRALTLAALLLAAPLPAQTAPAPPQGISGTVVSVDDDSVVLRQKDGSNATVAMTKGWTVSRPRKATVDELRLGDFVASASKDAGEGRGTANEMRIMEPGYRPEYGTHRLAGTQDVSMSHGFVFGIAKTAAGTEVTVAYPDGRRAIVVPGGMAITVSDLLPRSAAAPGVAFSGVTRPGADGVRRASRLTLAP